MYDELNVRKNDTDRICDLLSDIGWRYERESNKIQVSFQSATDSNVNLIVCIADVLPDKIFISTAIGIKATNSTEMLKLLNYINKSKIFYGRFVLADDHSVWFDYTVDIKPRSITKDEIYRAFSIADHCSEHFCKSIINVAISVKTADEAIETIK